MQRQLVIHADDLGLSPGVNAGILSAIQKGVVTSTSLMVNFPATAEALVSVKRHSLDVGWHVNLVQGRPLTPPACIPSLVDSRGNFLSPRVFFQKALLRRLNPQEVRLELQTQRRVFLEAGLFPSHVDGHLHIHAMPGVAPVLREILREQPIPFVRGPRESGGPGRGRFLSRAFLAFLRASHGSYWRETGCESLPFYGLSLSRSADSLPAWKKLLERISEPRAEVMVHPALEKAEGPTRSYGKQQNRQAEHDRLVSPELRELIQNAGFRLVSFRDLVPKIFLSDRHDL